MKEIRSYKDLEVWIQSRELVNEVYKLTKQFPRDEMYGLRDQMRRAAVSVLSNIAEACGRGTSKSTTSFLFISRGSLYEVETQLIIAFDQKYLSDHELQRLLEQITKCKKLINGFINYYDSKGTHS